MPGFFTQEQIDRGDAFGIDPSEYTIVGEDGKPIEKEDEGDDTDPAASAGGDSKTGADGAGPDDDGQKPDDAPGKKDEKAGGEGDGKQGSDKDSGEADGDYELVVEIDGVDVVVVDKDGNVNPDYADEVSEEDIASFKEKRDNEAKDLKDQGIMLPKTRYDHQKARADRLEREIEQLKQQMAQGGQNKQPPAPAEDGGQPSGDDKPDRMEQMLQQSLTDALKEKNQALVAGDVDKAAEMDLKIFDLRDELKEHRTKKAATKQPVKSKDQEPADPEKIRLQVREELMLEDAVDEAIDTYPQLNEGSDKFDQKLVNKLVEFRDFYVSKGRSPLEAFAEALEDIKPKLEAPKEEKPVLKKRLTNVRKNIEAAKAQPPVLDDTTGNNSDKAGLKTDMPDPTKITDDEWDKLPKEIKRRMRGDYV